MTDPAARPPQRRTTAWTALEAHAREGTLVLPRCSACGTVQYPLRELCRHCLADALAWTELPATGTLLSWTVLRSSLDGFFRAHLPWTVGLVKLDCGPVVMSHLFVPEPASGTAVAITLHRDAASRLVFVTCLPDQDLAADPRAKALLELEP